MDELRAGHSADSGGGLQARLDAAVKREAAERARGVFDAERETSAAMAAQRRALDEAHALEAANVARRAGARASVTSLAAEVSRRAQEEATWERAAAARVELAVCEVEGRAAAQAARGKAEHDTRIRTPPCGKQPPRGFRHITLQRPARPASARSSSGRPPASLGQPRPASASLGQPRPIGRCILAGRPYLPCSPHRHAADAARGLRAAAGAADRAQPVPRGRGGPAGVGRRGRAGAGGLTVVGVIGSSRPGWLPLRGGAF